MRQKNLLIVSIIAGLLWGIASSRLIFIGSWVSLLPWGLTAIILGAASLDKKRAMLNGAAYGFVLPLAFMFSGYSGPAEIGKLLSLFLFSIILGLLGALASGWAALIGNLLKPKRT